MQIEGIIFDWAGTTVDFGCMAPVRAFMDSFQAQGISVTEDETRKPMGLLKRDHIKTMLAMERIAALWQEQYGRPWTMDDVETIYSRFEPELMATLTNYTTVKPGILAVVQKLRDRGLKIGSTTGYTDTMMAVVVKAAAAQGYAPDCWFSPDAVGGQGRPYPYMIFKNMMELALSDVRKVIKIGDTVSDIQEGKAAGVWSVGVIDGSSVMGLSESQFANLSPERQQTKREAARQVFAAAGADFIIQDMNGLLDVIQTIEQQR